MFRLLVACLRAVGLICAPLLFWIVFTNEAPHPAGAGAVGICFLCLAVFGGRFYTDWNKSDAAPVDGVLRRSDWLLAAEEFLGAERTDAEDVSHYGIDKAKAQLRRKERLLNNAAFFLFLALLGAFGGFFSVWKVSSWVLCALSLLISGVPYLLSSTSIRELCEQDAKAEKEEALRVEAESKFKEDCATLLMIVACLLLIAGTVFGLLRQDPKWLFGSALLATLSAMIGVFCLPGIGGAVGGSYGETESEEARAQRLQYEEEERREAEREYDRKMDAERELYQWQREQEHQRTLTDLFSHG